MFYRERSLTNRVPHGGSMRPQGHGMRPGKAPVRGFGGIGALASQTTIPPYSQRALSSFQAGMIGAHQDPQGVQIPAFFRFLAARLPRS